MVEKKKRNLNPNKVNEYTEPDPRQSLFLNKYLNPKSKTFGNAYQSAIDVGYKEDYAKNIMNKGTDCWWKMERRINMLEC